jgi:formylglycine-generating enzyme required for sulfatase activity
MTSRKTTLGVTVVMFLLLAVNPVWAQEKALPEKMSLDLGGGVKMDFILVHPGRFMMGSEKGEGNEKPVHEVKITKPFCMGVYEVTQAQWNAVMEDTLGYFSHFNGDNLPVEEVSWEDCQKFAAKLKEKAGQGMVCRLPTEAEWEYACRAGSQAAYCFGDAQGGLGEYAWHYTDSGMTTRPVGQKRPNAWGLYDMHGNVFEWCADWYRSDYYVKSPKENPPGPSEAEADVVDLMGRQVKCRVLRGGSWNYFPYGLRSARRDRNDPTGRNDFVGLRVVLRPQE